MITQYTCLLDVDIWVHGGGFTGQAESIVPAIAKAIQNYDVKTNVDCSMFNPVRESLMGLVGISSINCNPKHTPGSC